MGSEMCIRDSHTFYLWQGTAADARGIVYHTFHTTVVVHSTVKWVPAALEPDNGPYLAEIVRTPSLVLEVARKTGWPWEKGSLQA